MLEPGATLRPAPGHVHPSGRPDGAAPAEVTRQAAVDAALAHAESIARRYRGPLDTTEEVVDFVRRTVIAALLFAPQPVTEAWVRFSLAVVRGLATACQTDHVPLVATAVFDPGTVDRFIHVHCKGHQTQAQAGYRSRCDVIGEALLTGVRNGWTRPSLSADDTMAPYPHAHIGALHTWSLHHRPAARRHRIQAILTCGLGAGLRRRDLNVVTGDDVLELAHGTHLRVRHDDTDDRVVPVADRWTPDIRALATRAGSNLLIAPHTTTITHQSIDQTIARANDTAPHTINTRRMRNTWLLHHVVHGTPLPLLMQYAGITTTRHIEDLLQYADRVTTDDAARTLHGHAA